jgi:hypothetical protein
VKAFRLNAGSALEHADAEVNVVVVQRLNSFHVNEISAIF